jgi:hypothetical protein
MNKRTASAIRFTVVNRATIMEASGGLLVLIGLWHVWYPLSLLAAGAGLAGLGILLDYTERRNP